MNFLLMKFTNLMNVCHLAGGNLDRRRGNRVLLLEKMYHCVFRSKGGTLEAAGKGKGSSTLRSISPVTDQAVFALPSSSFLQITAFSS